MRASGGLAPGCRPRFPGPCGGERVVGMEPSPWRPRLRAATRDRARALDVKLNLR